jgi:hypothetical protein
MSDATSISSAQDRRWLILGVIGLAQLMVVLDLTVMNIALPSAQRALDFTTADRQWVVTAYTLAFGSLLLPGGRLADLLGRKVTFLTGLAGFAGVSAMEVPDWSGRSDDRPPERRTLMPAQAKSAAQYCSTRQLARLDERPGLRTLRVSLGLDCLDAGVRPDAMAGSGRQAAIQRTYPHGAH